MPTPAIQTLITDAQQVLNLKSLSEIRATMAAALANANVGTPLNPNLTTQQLWDEFYLIVRQPESDIESIITNQLMKFLYAPPAPGGVGANGQVIFNDGGVLAGDAGLTYNKTTDALTISGALTANSVSSSSSLIASGAVPANQTSKSVTDFLTNSSRFLSWGDVSNEGSFQWYTGIGATAPNPRMTLNATGLGVGVASPSYQLHVTKDQSSQTAVYVDNQQNNAAASSALTLSAYGGIWNLSVPHSATFVNPLIFKFGSTETARLTSDGNLVLKGGTTTANGVGVTFPATQVASSDANTLDDYKESTWTPVITAASGTPTTVTVNSAVYTKIGRVVVCTFDISIVNKGTASSSLQFGLPVTSITSTAFCGSFREDGSTGNMGMVIYSTGTTAACLLYNNATPWVDGYRLKGTYTYFAA